MKKIFKYAAVLSLAALTMSCEKYGEKIVTPTVKVTVSPENPKIGEEVTVTIESDAQYLTVFTGDQNHMYERSRIKAIIENDWESFSDTVYKKPLWKEGQNCTWNRYFKDYKTVEEVKEDFDFFGAIGNVELVKYNETDFPEALIGMSYPGQNVLKVEVTDRRKPSGITMKMKDGLYVIGGQIHEAGNSIVEARFVGCDEDKAVRKYANNFFVDAKWGFHTTQMEDFAGFEAGYKYDAIISRGRFLTSETNDPFGARPTEGFFKLWQMYDADGKYLKKFVKDGEKVRIDKIDMYFTSDCVQKGGNRWKYDLDGDGVEESYVCEVNPETGFPAKQTDYNKYKGFQGTVYLSYFEMGSKEYEPWHVGESLGSVYSPEGLKKTFTYKYTEAGEFDLSVVAANVGNKDHSQIDYDGDRKNALTNYPALRSVATVKIKVTE